MDSTLEHESNRSRRVCNQLLKPGGTLKIILDFSYNCLPQITTACKTIFGLHQWNGVMLRTSVFFVLHAISICVYIFTYCFIKK